MRSALNLPESEIFKLQKALETLVNQTGLRVAKKAVREGTQPLLMDMKNSAPVGPTGLLKKSIKKRVRGYQKNGIVIGLVGVSRGVSGTHNGKKVVPANYAHLVEFGRSRVTAKNAKVLSSGAVVFGRQVKASAARPFVRPAYDRQKSRMESITRGSVKKGIESIAKGIR